MMPRQNQYHLIDFSQFVAPPAQTAIHSVQEYPCMKWKIFFSDFRAGKIPSRAQRPAFAPGCFKASGIR